MSRHWGETRASRARATGWLTTWYGVWERWLGRTAALALLSVHPESSWSVMSIMRETFLPGPMYVSEGSQDR